MGWENRGGRRFVGNSHFYHSYGFLCLMAIHFSSVQNKACHLNQLESDYVVDRVSKDLVRSGPEIQIIIIGIEKNRH